jgi:hypothetical protein
MPSQRFQPSPHREEAKQAFRDGATIEEVLKRFPISPKTAERYQLAVEAEKKAPPPPPPPPPSPGPDASKAGAKPAVVAGGELGTIVGAKAGTIIFSFGQEIIPLNYFNLYDAFQYYKDMQREHGIEEDFSQTVKDSVKHAWEILNRHKAQKLPVAVAVKEVGDEHPGTAS